MNNIIIAFVVAVLIRVLDIELIIVSLTSELLCTFMEISQIVVLSPSSYVFLYKYYIDIEVYNSVMQLFKSIFGLILLIILRFDNSALTSELKGCVNHSFCLLSFISLSFFFFLLSSSTFLHTEMKCSFPSPHFLVNEILNIQNRLFKCTLRKFRHCMYLMFCLNHYFILILILW